MYGCGTLALIKQGNPLSVPVYYKISRRGSLWFFCFTDACENRGEL